MNNLGSGERRKNSLSLEITTFFFFLILQSLIECYPWPPDRSDQQIVIIIPQFGRRIRDWIDAFFSHPHTRGRKD